MTIKRELKFDEKTKILHVKTEEDFTIEQIKEIVSDLESKLKQANEILEKIKTHEWALKKIESEPRTKEFLEIVASLSELKIPNKESLEKTVKYWKEKKTKIEEDLAQLKPILEKI